MGGLKQRLGAELRSLAITMAYFGTWIAVLLWIKHLILEEYGIGFEGFSKALIGALVLSKVVLLMEYVPLGRWIGRRAAWVDVVARTAMYAVGVFAVLLLEKAIDSRHEQGGLAQAIRAAFSGTGMPHVWANTICITGSLLVFNGLFVVGRHLGAGGLLAVFRSPVPEVE